ncbi:MAG TPA: nitrilase-related carbon-nitrogen hydrolase [Steroidobacteraceae bacterium]|nr:nitrilase-related carbon-nitrogen hydrolase [Steroidobacteraceae bacterium]
MSIRTLFSRSAVAATLATAICFLLSTDLGTIGPLILLAPVPILLFALRCGSTLRVAIAAFLARVIGALGIAFAYGDVLPPLPLALEFVVLASQFTVAVLATRWASRRLPPWATALLFASLLIALEFLLSLRAPHGSFGALGYALIQVLPLAQVASIGGLAAVGFIAALVPASIAMLVFQPQQWRSMAALAAIPLALSLAFGAWRLAQPYDSHTRVGLASIDSLTAHSLRGSEQANAVTREYERVLESFRNQNLSQIVLPERVFLANPNDQHASQTLQSAADELNVRIVAGFDDTDAAGLHRNTARTFTPHAPLHVYAKRKLVPGLELLTPGNQPLLLHDRGIAICKDMDFPALFRDYGNGGVRLLLVPAWDFVKDGRLHSRMAVMRGIENGFAVARAAATGRLTVSDAYGRIIAEAVTSRDQPVTLVAEVGLTTAGTLYSRIGDVFAWLLVLMTAALLVWSGLISAGAPQMQGRLHAESTPPAA